MYVYVCKNLRVDCTPTMRFPALRVRSTPKYWNEACRWVRISFLKLSSTSRSSIFDFGDAQQLLVTNKWRTYVCELTSWQLARNRSRISLFQILLNIYFKYKNLFIYKIYILNTKYWLLLEQSSESPSLYPRLTKLLIVDILQKLHYKLQKLYNYTSW